MTICIKRKSGHKLVVEVNNVTFGTHFICVTHSEGLCEYVRKAEIEYITLIF